MRIILIDIIIPEKYLLCFLICQFDSKLFMGWDHSILAKTAGKSFINHVETENSSFCFWSTRLCHSQKSRTVWMQTSCSVWLTFIFSTLNLSSRNLPDRKSTRLNSSHVAISYAVCC